MRRRAPEHSLGHAAAGSRRQLPEAWRRQARLLFVYSSPILKLLNDRETTVYDLLGALLPICAAAYRSECRWELQRVFDFVDWCWRQEGPNEDLSNAAGVAFYEHLRDYLPAAAVRTWLLPDVFDDLKYLFQEPSTDL